MGGSGNQADKQAKIDFLKISFYKYHQKNKF